MRETLRALALSLAVIALLGYLLGAGKPAIVIGMFVVSGLAVGSLYAFGGIGLVVLYRATGVLNLAAGAIGMVAVMAAWQLLQWGMAPVVAWAAGLLLAVGLALGNGGLIAARMAWREPVVKAVASLGFALVLLGLVSFLFADNPRSFGLPSDHVGIRLVGLRVTLTRIIVVVAALVFVIAIGLGLEHTRMGLQMRALANDRRLSSLIGVPIGRVELVAWGCSGLLFGFTGLMFGDLVRLQPAVVTFLVIPCIAAAIAGQLRSLPLVLIGGLTMGVIESLLALSPPPAASGRSRPM